MGGNQNENGRVLPHNIPPYMDETIEGTPNTSKVIVQPGLATIGTRAWDRASSSSSNNSYFSTLQVPKTFSFEQNFRRTNSPMLSSVQATLHDRSLSSSMNKQTVQPQDLNCGTGTKPNSSSLPRFSPGQSAFSGDTIREHCMSGSRYLRSSGQPSREGNKKSTYLKRQKYLEQRRTASSCWPSEARKRSSHSDDEEENISQQPIRKVFVNEAKMAARFDGLSLSHQVREEYSSSFHFGSVADARRIMADIDSRLMDSDDEEDDETLTGSMTHQGQRLQMAAPLKTALRRSKTELLPDKIVQKIANPCTAMLLWQPSVPLKVDSSDVPLKVHQPVVSLQDSDDASEMDCVERDVNIERPLQTDIKIPQQTLLRNCESDDVMEL